MFISLPIPRMSVSLRKLTYIICWWAQQIRMTEYLIIAIYLLISTKPTVVVESPVIFVSQS